MVRNTGGHGVSVAARSDRTARYENRSTCAIPSATSSGGWTSVPLLMQFPRFRRTATTPQKLGERYPTRAPLAGVCIRRLSTRLTSGQAGNSHKSTRRVFCGRNLCCAWRFSRLALPPDTSWRDPKPQARRSAIHLPRLSWTALHQVARGEIAAWCVLAVVGGRVRRAPCSRPRNRRSRSLRSVPAWARWRIGGSDDAAASIGVCNPASVTW